MTMSAWASLETVAKAYAADTAVASKGIAAAFLAGAKFGSLRVANQFLAANPTPLSPLMPIETAPKDGTWFLAYREAAECGTWDRFVVVRWHDEFSDFIWPDQPFDIFNDDIDEIRENGVHVQSPYEATGTFTAWCPLPAHNPPSQPPAPVNLDAAIADVVWVQEHMPIDFIMHDECPMDRLMHVLGVLKHFAQIPAPSSHVSGIDWSNPEDPAVKLFVGYDVEGYVEHYEFVGNDGEYSPNGKEKMLIDDAVRGVICELHEQLQKILPSTPSPETRESGQ